MRAATSVLAVSTISLAVVAGYLWKQLDAERDRAQSEARQRTELQARLANARHEQPASTHNTATSTPPVPPRVARTAGAPDLHSAQARRQEALKGILDDPREREGLKEQSRRNLRAANGDLARELELTDAEYAALIELLAENDLQVTAMTERDPSSGYPTNDFLALRDRLERDIADLLGAEKAQQYSAYEDSWQVRNQVQQLRGRLSPSDALTEEQNRQLMAALKKERLSFNEDMQRRVPSERVVGHKGAWEGATFVADSASTLPVQEQYLRQMEEFAKRQRQRAAEILTARQLRVFAQMQDEVLTRERLEARTTTLVEQGV